MAFWQSVERNLYVRLIKLADVRGTSGDLATGRKRYEESLDIRNQLAQQIPASAEAARDVMVSLWKLASLPGGVAMWADVV